MIAALIKIIILPAVFVLPLILVMTTNWDQFLLRELANPTPLALLLTVILLTPGFVISIMWLSKAFKR